MRDSMIHFTMIHSSMDPEGPATFHATLDTQIHMHGPMVMEDTMDLEITSIQPTISIAITATIYISLYMLIIAEDIITALEEVAR